MTIANAVNFNGTFPASGVLVNTAVTTLSSLASVGTITSGTWNSSLAGNNSNSTLSLFAARASGAQTISKGSEQTIVFDTEDKDQGNNFASNTFTAPKTGLYLFQVTLNFNVINSANEFYSALKLPATDIIMIECNPTNYIAGGMSFTGCILTPMNSGDTAYVISWMSGGTSTYATYVGHLCPRFSGFFVC